MTTLKELEKWRDDPKNWSVSESVNCTILLDNLFHTTDLWNIVLEFSGVGVADFYQDSRECCKCDCDKRIHSLSKNGIGIGCIDIHAKDNVLLNRRTTHIDDFLWSIGYSCKHFYNVIKTFQESLEYKKFIINNNVIYKIEMLKSVNYYYDISDKCETLTLSEVYKQVLNGSKYPSAQIKEKVENFIKHDCEDFNTVEIPDNTWKHMNYKQVRKIYSENTIALNAYKYEILTNEAHKILKPIDKYDENIGWYKHTIKCKECLKFLNHSPTCYCRENTVRNTWRNRSANFLIKPKKIYSFNDKEIRQMSTRELREFKTGDYNLDLKVRVIYIKKFYPLGKYDDNSDVDSDYWNPNYDITDSDYDSD